MEGKYLIRMDGKCLIHGGPGSGRWPKGSSGNTPGSRYIPKERKNPFKKTLDEKEGKFKSASPRKVEKNKETYGLTKKEKQPLTPEQKQKQINNLNAATQLTKIGTQTVGQAKQVHDSYLSSKKAKSALEEAQQMSDKELRDRVNRLNLERQYSQMSPATVSKGQQAVSAALNAAQIAGGLAVTGLTIATLIKQLKGN